MQGYLVFNIFDGFFAITLILHVAHLARVFSPAKYRTRIWR